MIFRTAPPVSSRRSAFTLLEILVATAVTTLLLVLLLVMIQNSLAIYSRITRDPEAFAESRLAAARVASDLAALAVPDGTDVEALRVTPEPANSVGRLGAESAVWLTFVTSATDPDDSTPTAVDGAIRSVSYRLALQNPIDGSSLNPGYALHRSIASGAYTFANALGKTNLQTTWGSPPAAPAPTPLPATAVENYLAGAVVGFQVLFEYLDDKGTADPGDDSFVWTTPGDSVRITGTGSELNGQTVPGGFRRAEVTLTVLSRQGVMRLQDNILSLDEAIRKYGRTIVSQAELPGKQ
jgi:type II secretory pathway pseudopilin PulG